MDKVFYYSVLSYRYSALLSESINVGVLTYFPEECKMMFWFPDNLDRVKRMYPDISIETLKLSLSYIAVRAQMAEPKWFDNPTDRDRVYVIEDAINDHILRKDAAGLQFDNMHISLRYNFDLATITKEIFTLYHPDRLWV